MLPADPRLRATAIALLILASAALSTRAAAADKEICDVQADFALQLEDYPIAIKLHRKTLSSYPNSALAHYHLGFAYGMIGRGSEEIREYRKAVALGLRVWDLFLDLGLAYLEEGDYPNGIEALQTSTLLGPQQPEAHFNLAMAYEKADRLNDAMREIITSLQMAPENLDMRNTKAIICAELGDLTCARDEWALLLQITPSYAPARKNLAILMGSTPESLPSLRNTLEVPALHAMGR